MKLVVALLAAAVFASLICRASFERIKEWDSLCENYKSCMTYDAEPIRIPKKEEPVYLGCECVIWGCVIDEVYYSGVGCGSDDMVCKGANEGLSKEQKEDLIEAEDDCDPLNPPPITTTTTTTTPEPPSTTITTSTSTSTTPAPKPTTKEALKTTTSGTDESNYGAWKLVGMAFIGCFVFFFCGQLS